MRRRGEDGGDEPTTEGGDEPTTPDGGGTEDES